MAQANRGLTPHYFLNFSVVGDVAAAAKGPPRRGFSNTWNRLTHARQTQETVLHIDVASSAITTVDRETEATVAKIDDVLEVSSLPGQSMHLVLALRGGQAPKFQFQTNHDAIIFQTTLLQLMHGGHMAQLPHPRQLLKRGPIQKRGRNGRFSERFAVLVPARMFIMRSREAKFPQIVLSLVSTKLAFAAESRTISLPVGGKTYVLRGVTDDDASDWVRRIEGSIGLRYNPYKYSKQATTADASALDADEPPESEAGKLPPQPPSPLAAPGEPATIWHANEAAEDAAGEGPDAEQLSQITAALLGASDDGDDRSVSQLAEEPDETDWQQVADAVRDDSGRSAHAYGGRGGGGRHSDSKPIGSYGAGGDTASDGNDDGVGDDEKEAIVYRDSDGATYEDTLEEAFSADGSLAGENARIWGAPAKQSVEPGTMTEPLGGTRNDDVLEAAEEVAVAARQYQQPLGAAVSAPQQPRATHDDAALPLQEHIGAVLTRVRSLMSDVSSFKTQQAALAAANQAAGTLGADGGRINGSSGSGGGGGKQLEQIAAAWSQFQDGAAARALLQQWQAQQSGSKGGSGMSAAFMPTQAVRVQELLQELVSLSAEAGQSAGKPDRQLAVDLGGGINLQLLPNMRIVIEMDGASTPAAPLCQPLMTAEKCAQIAQASIAAAQAAQAAVRNGSQR